MKWLKPLNMMRKLPFLSLILTLFGLLVACQTYPPEVALPDRPATSPSGQYQLEVIESQRLSSWNFVIKDQNGVEIHQSYDPADWYSYHHTTYFVWDAADRVWVYSGDVGTFYWERQPDGRWLKKSYHQNPIPAPQFLKDERPEQFTN